jgi:NADPH:quinone reductase-like Zn-dependent oxidoreductase
MIPFRSSAVDNLRLKCGEIAGDPHMRAYEPIIDREFGFEDAPAAYRHLESGAHFGKVVIRL